VKEITEESIIATTAIRGTGKVFFYRHNNKECILIGRKLKV